MEKNPSNIKNYVLANRKPFSILDKPLNFSKSTIILPYSIRGLAYRKSNKDSRLKKLSFVKYKYKLLSKAFLSNCSAEVYGIDQILTFFKLAHEVAALTSFLKIDKFIFKETHHTIPDAIQIISEEMNVQTIAIQYSNLPLTNVLMLSTSDKYLIFSEHFKSIFSTNDFYPKQFIITGYLYRKSAFYVENRALSFKKSLRQKGVNFIQRICHHY